MKEYRATLVMREKYYLNVVANSQEEAQEIAESVDLADWETNNDSETIDFTIELNGEINE